MATLLKRRPCIVRHSVVQYPSSIHHFRVYWTKPPFMIRTSLWKNVARYRDPVFCPTLATVIMNCFRYTRCTIIVEMNYQFMKICCIGIIIHDLIKHAQYCGRFVAKGKGVSNTGPRYKNERYFRLNTFFCFVIMICCSSALCIPMPRRYDFMTNFLHISNMRISMHC